MLQDYVRTGAYQNAMFSNPASFKDKVILDVGTGTGILSFFAVQAGARKVYAVEASDAAKVAKILSAKNGFDNKVEIIFGKIEEIELPEKVDVIISEPIGFLLVHERMLESYAIARDRFLKPDGLMFPTTGSIVLAPFSDDSLYNEQNVKAQFWENSNFFGIDLTPLVDQAQDEYFSQPIVGYFHTSCIISSHRTVHSIDFQRVSCLELQNFEINFSFRIDKTSIMHGIAGWFDINFVGKDCTVVLSTSPEAPGTHWYQCRLLFKEPIAVNKGQYVIGTLNFEANEKFSYNLVLNARIDGTTIEASNRLNLHDQHYHYLSSSSSATDMQGGGHGHN